MRSYVRGFSLVFFMLIAACGNGGSVDDDKYKMKMMENMTSASLWIIQDGINVFSEKGKNGIHRKLVDEWGVQIWVDPWVETERYLAQFRIKARGINYDIHNLYREKAGRYFYEFWLIKIAAKSWSGESDRSIFYMTKTTDIYGHREILETSDQFFDSYKVDNRVIRLPTNNLELLYDMEAWLFPDNYRESDLKDRKVVMNSDGDISEE